jgi:site-specific recombinase XerD
MAMNGNTLAVYAGSLADDLEQNGYRRTARAYRTTAAKFVKFNDGKDIELEYITSALVNDFQQTMKTEGTSLNTISFYMRTLRAIYNKAIDEKRIAPRLDNPFSGVYTGLSLSRKLALNPEELTLLAQFDPTRAREKKVVKPNGEFTKSLQDALAMFLFCYHAHGMYFVDMAHLKRSNITGNTIHYSRKKTGQRLEIKILPPMRRILDYFDPMTVGSEYLFPVITDQKKDLYLQYESGLTLQNQRLKKIAAITGIGKKLSSNCARHSWATMAKSGGLPLAVISDELGHSSLKATKIYLASLQ